MTTNGDRLTLEITNFLVDRAARKRSERTLSYYRDELDWFRKYLETQDVGSWDQVTPGLVRSFLVQLGERRSRGGVHANYRAIKAFFNWFGEEYQGPGWKNPVSKVHLDTPPKDPIPGIPLLDIKKMVSTCDRSFHGVRDRALVWFLVDTGVRMAELCSLNVEDVDLLAGTVAVRHGKGGRPRTTYMGAYTRREVARFLRVRKSWGPADPLFVTQEGDRLTRSGLREIIRRRAGRAGLQEPGLHAFRRTFALESLRNGCDIYSLMRMMGHTTTTVLSRYLALVQDDVQNAHRTSSPVDNR